MNRAELHRRTRALVTDRGVELKVADDLYTNGDVALIEQYEQMSPNQVDQVNQLYRARAAMAAPGKGLIIPRPKRIQRKRTKGWRMPEGAVYVGRPSRWGNPFSVAGVRGGSVIGPRWFDVKDWHLERSVRLVDDELLALYSSHSQRAAAIEASVRLYRDLVNVRLRDYPGRTRAWLIPLAGHDLACWCPLEDAEGRPVPCHANVLLEVANR